MRQLGDVTKINGGKIEAVDIITFGSPCQDLSVSGRQQGLAGRRSGLFFEAIRIIKEMRCTTNGLYPAFAVWENVPGAFSSNHRMDFKAVLEAVTEAEVPMPPSGKWAGAGMVRGNRTDVGWRTLDAQYWGELRLQQRRKRVFLLADFTGTRAGEILFKPRRMLPAPAPCCDFGLSAAGADQLSLKEAGREKPVVRPFLDRRMRGAAKHGKQAAFLASFGRADDPFPTLLAGSLQMFAFWYEGREQEGFLRFLLPIECERLMGLPEGWTACGYTGEPVSDHIRYQALGNAIALPCAEYILAGIREVFK